jgi:hypothetical protein
MFDSAIPVSYHTYRLPSAPLTIAVAFSNPANGLVTVDVDQSEYNFK